LTIAGTEAEVLEIAEYHATSKHGMKKEPALRATLKGLLKEEKVGALSR
jgi:predicted small metal-binding protein